MKFSNKQLYKLRQSWILILKSVQKLDSLTKEQLSQYGIHPSENFGNYRNEDCGKFIDDYYHYAYLRDQASEDPLTREEIAKMKDETKQEFNEAFQLMYNRDCRFESEKSSVSYLSKYADCPYQLENAIRKATDIIVPEYSFYKKSNAELSLKLIDEDITLCKEQISDHESSISSIGYEHFEDGELGIIDYDVNERYKPHEDALKHLREAIKTLESFKTKVLTEEKKEEAEDQKSKNQANKRSIFKRVINKLKRKINDTTSTDENSSNEDSTNTEHPGGAWRSDW